MDSFHGWSTYVISLKHYGLMAGEVGKIGFEIPRKYQCFLYGGFLKCWYPTSMGFPTENDHFWGVLGVPPFKETTI